MCRRRHARYTKLLRRVFGPLSTCQIGLTEDRNPLVKETDFVPIERQSVVSEATAQIRRLISSASLAPGEQLPAERSLSALLGCRGPRSER